MDISSFGLHLWLLIFIYPILSILQIIIVKIRFPWLNKIDDLLSGYEMDVSITCDSGIMEKLRKVLEKEMKVATCNETHLVLLKPSFIAISQKINVSLSKPEDGACLINIQSYNRRTFWTTYTIVDFGSNYKNCLKIKRLLIRKL
ncbi:MAG: hypothetical protein PF484_00955 [Bacteroidales bacterium]|jgi:hypothetical protein|nr:hypothetical protein [Bacteroidales bacterium]